jgi:hypothetical protein
MLTLTDSTIADNTLQGGNGGSGSGLAGSGGVSQGGGLYLSGAMLTVADSTIADNAIQGGEGVDGGVGGSGQGGGFYISGTQTTLTVSNATIASNTARGGDGVRGGAGGAAQGGGLWVGAGASTQVTFSTIAINQAAGGSADPGYNGIATGGGVFNVQGMLQTRDTLLAGNMVNGPGTNSGPDLAGDLGSLGHNLIGNSQGGSGYDGTDLLDVDPRLGPLQDNGGPADTMALLPGSPAIDAGDNTGAPMWDQRGPGFRRIVNGTIDIGAFEVQAHAHNPPTGQPLPDPVAVQALGMPGGPLLGQPPDLPGAPSPVPGLLDGQAGQAEPVAVPTAGEPPAPATRFGAAAGHRQPANALGPPDACDLDPLAQELLGGP